MKDMTDNQNSKTRIYAVLSLLAVSALFIALGVMRGEVRIIFDQAADVCFECMGIG